MSWLDKYPEKKQKTNLSFTSSLLIKLGFLLIFVVLLYFIIQKAVHFVGEKVSPMVVQTTSVAGSGLAASFLLTKLLPFFLAFKVFIKIIKTILTLLLITGLFLLYLNLKHPETFHAFVQLFS